MCAFITCTLLLFTSLLLSPLSLSDFLAFIQLVLLLLIYAFLSTLYSQLHYDNFFLRLRDTRLELTPRVRGISGTVINYHLYCIFLTLSVFILLLLLLLLT